MRQRNRGSLRAQRELSNMASGMENIAGEMWETSGFFLNKKVNTNTKSTDAASTMEVVKMHSF